MAEVIAPSGHIITTFRQPRPKLQITRLSTAGNLPEFSARQAAIGRPQSAIVERVERLEPQLQIHSFTKLLLPRQPHIPVAGRWSAQVCLYTVPRPACVGR